MKMTQSPRIGATPSEPDAYNQLRCYTLVHGDPAFIHQHVVDAFAAQMEKDLADDLRRAVYTVTARH